MYFQYNFTVDALTTDEANTVEKFLKKADEPVVQDKPSTKSPNRFLELRHTPKNEDQIHQAYEGFMAVPCTSNICERLFSRSKLVIGSLRQSLTPEHVESILYLLCNRDLWNCATIQSILDGEATPVPVSVEAAESSSGESSEAEEASGAEEE
jgi:hypothetical protein